ncbi:MAG: hypothetical protein GKR89_23055 [Candidatus Latescibacteria bacterium]|nr:hypothetical protein [Candidatus Latescibacterota bacterium]
MKRFLVLVLTAGFLLQAGAVQAELKVGYINSELIKEKLPEFKDIRRQLDQLRQQYEREASERESKLIKFQDDLRKQELLMSEARKAEMRAQLEEQIRQLQEFVQQKLGSEGELMRKNIELSSPVLEKINAALEEMAKDDGYDFIFDVAAAAIVYSPERYDVTEDLLKRLADQREKVEGEQ